MGDNAATQTGAADGSKPTATTTEGRPVVRPSRMEALNQIGKTRAKNFNDEQRQAGSTEFIPEDGEELGTARQQPGEDPEDIDHEDLEAEKERKRLEAEAAAQERAEREAREARKPAKSEVDRQLDEDDRATVIDDPAKVRVRMKVDGEERIVPLADLVRTGQKEAAADRRLEEAAQRMKDAERLEAEAKEKLRVAGEHDKARAEREAAEAKKAREEAAKNLKDRLKHHADLLYEGKVDEASDLMLQLLQPVYERSLAPTPATVDEDAIAARAAGKVKSEVKQELKTESALEAFAERYPEIFADPDLRAMADRHLEAAVKKGLPFTDALTEAGDSTRAYLKDLAKKLGMQEGRTTTTRRESLEQRKATIDEPESASLATSLKDAAPQPGNASSVIAEMAASRPGAIAQAAAAKRHEGT